MNQSISFNNNELWINSIKVDPAPCGNICMVNGKTTSGDYVLVGTKWIHKKDAPKENFWKRLKSFIINT